MHAVRLIVAIAAAAANRDFKRHEVQMRWSMYDQRSRQRVPELSDRTIAAIALESPTTCG